MRTFTFLKFPSVLAALVLFVAACGEETADPTAEPAADDSDDEAEAEPGEGEVVIYGSLHEEEIERLGRAFTEATGIGTETLRASSGELTARVQAEAGNPSGDIILGGPSENHEALIPDGLLAPYEAQEAIEVYDEDFYHSEHYWHGFYVGALGLGINTELWEEQFGDQEYPQAWDDLLDPQFENTLAVASPASSGTAYNLLVAQIFRLGEEEAWEWFEEFDNTVAHYSTSGAAPARQAGAGEYLMAITFGHDILRPVQAGFPLEIVYPEDTGYEVGAVSIIEGGPNTENAQEFVEWMLGREANQLHTDLTLRSPLRDDVDMPGDAVDLDEISLVEGFDAEWAGENRDRLISEWDERIGG